MEYLLNHLLTNSAVRYAAKEAVRIGESALTYLELDRLTNQVARALRAAGVQKGDRVGIYVHKSLASIICVFGILKIGAAYVPLDPNAPAKRLAYITRDCGIKVLLTSAIKVRNVREIFAEGTPLQAILLMDDYSAPLPNLSDQARFIFWNDVRTQDYSDMAPTEVIETDLAYILYTSGSTGVPKGVMITHRTIFTFINWCRDRFRLTPEDRVTSHAPLHFDLSTFDIYATIQAGATIVLVGENLSTLPIQLADLLQNERITITYLVPSILSLMINYGNLGAHDLSKLRAVLFAGEIFPMKYLRRLMAAIPCAVHYNLYGPTETNVCTYYQVKPEDTAPERGDQPVPIGQACENVEVFALNERGQLVTEPGQEGELWVRGSCVAQGYWGDRERTAKSFVQNPYQPLFQEIAYRTGDIVTLAPDRKNWIYIGRRDQMIKTRGYRVELGEIENALYRHEDVKEVAVVAIPDDLLGNRIQAFVVPAAGSVVTPKELENFCARHVPKYMIPERIEYCESLPKTSSGKINRAALISRNGAVPDNRSSVVRTPATNDI